MVHFGAYYRWLDLKYFAVRSEAPDLSLLASLIRHEQYHDHYASEDPSDQTHHCVHGPYRLEAIPPAGV